MVQIESNVATAYEDVRNDKTPTNWLLIGYGDEKGETLNLVKTGNFRFSEPCLSFRCWRTRRIQKTSRR